MATTTTLKGDKYQLLVNELSNIKKVEFLNVHVLVWLNRLKMDILKKKTYEMLENWLKPMKRK